MSPIMSDAITAQQIREHLAGLSEPERRKLAQEFSLLPVWSVLCTCCAIPSRASMGSTVVVGSAEWRVSFWDYAHKIRAFFKIHAAKLTDVERRELAVDMGLPVAEPFKRPEPAPDEVVTRLREIHEICFSADRGSLQLEIRNVMQLLAGRVEDEQEKGRK